MCTGGIGGVHKTHSSEKKKSKQHDDIQTFSKFRIPISPNTKIFQYSIKLELKELYKNVALFCFFSFNLYRKKIASKIYPREHHITLLEQNQTLEKKGEETLYSVEKMLVLKSHTSFSGDSPAQYFIPIHLLFSFSYRLFPKTS